jgi:hypothetical protein
LPFRAFAQEPERAIVVYQGVKGYWFSETIGEKLLKDVSELSIIRQKLSEFNLKLELKDEKLELVKYQLKLESEISARWKTAFEGEVQLVQKEQQRYDALRDKENAWYKSNALWCGVGAVLGAALAVGLTFGLQEAKE